MQTLDNHLLGNEPDRELLDYLKSQGLEEQYKKPIRKKARECMWIGLILLLYGPYALYLIFTFPVIEDLYIIYFIVIFALLSSLGAIGYYFYVTFPHARDYWGRHYLVKEDLFLMELPLEHYTEEMKAALTPTLEKEIRQRKYWMALLEEENILLVQNPDRRIVGMNKDVWILYGKYSGMVMDIIPKEEVEG